MREGKGKGREALVAAAVQMTFCSSHVKSKTLMCDKDITWREHTLSGSVRLPPGNALEMRLTATNLDTAPCCHASIPPPPRPWSAMCQ